MWKDLDLERMTEEENAYSPPRPPEEIEPIVVLARLELGNRAGPYGARAVHRRLNTFYHLKPLPSVRTIGRILKRNGLIERR
jgi:hypothetical protein